MRNKEVLTRVKENEFCLIQSRRGKGIACDRLVIGKGILIKFLWVQRGKSRRRKRIKNGGYKRTKGLGQEKP